MKQSINGGSYGKAEILQRKIDILLKSSEEPEFTAYLRQMSDRTNRQIRELDGLNRDLDQKYEIYCQRQMAARAAVLSGNTTGQGIGVQNVPAQNISVQPLDGGQMPIQSQPVYMPDHGQPPYVAVKKEKKGGNMEFAVGLWLFSIIGVLFLLASFVMLGMTYMNGLVKGISLYGISLVFILVSELILRRKMEKFSLGITGLGICSLYAATMLNYQYLQNFSGWIAVLITFMITCGAVLLSRKKDSGSIKIISFIGCYIALFSIGRFSDNTEFITIAAILFAVNLMTVLLPVKRVQRGVSITHMVSNTIFTFGFTASVWSSIDGSVLLLYVISNIFLLGIIFFQAEQSQQTTGEDGKSHFYGSLTWIYILTLILQSGFLAAMSWVNYRWNFFWMEPGEEYFGIHMIHITAGTYIFAALILFLMFRKSSLRWIQYYAVNAVIFLFYVLVGNRMEGAIAMLSLFVVSKLLSGIKELRVFELIVTAVTAFTAMVFCNGQRDGYTLLFAGGFLLSVLVLNHFKTTYQIIITCMLVILAADNLQDVGKMIPAVSVAIIFLMLLLFNHVKRLESLYQKRYNYASLGFLVFWYLGAVLLEDHVSYAILTVLGISVIVFLFQEKYHMNFKYKHLCLAIFLSYMTLISRIDIPVVTSGILMLIAIGSVVTGFALRKKNIRIYGLVLSLAVCLKIMLYDFVGVASLERMLLFMVVGILILAISCIYAILEKRMTNRGENL